MFKDEAEFAELFRKYAAALNDFAYSLVKSKDVAEDVVQEVFIRLWDNKTSLNVRQSINVYLYRAVRNAALDRIKRDKITQRYLESEIDNQYTESPDVELEGAALLKALDSAIDNLPERAGDVLRLRIEHGLSNAEIAEVMGISVKGVEKARWRALEALKGLLRPYK